MSDKPSTNIWTRRSVLQGAAAVAAMAALSPAAAALPNAISPDEALRRLQTGNARYVRNELNAKDFSAGRAARAQSQFPVAAILGCADSRVSPELNFDQGPGELFVCRVAGNYMNVDNRASLEYGVEVLGAPLVVVLGHTNCGAVKAVLQYAKDRKPLPGHLHMIVDALYPGVAESIKQGQSDQLDHAIEANVRHNVQRLQNAHPVIAKALDEHKVKILGAIYELDTGKVRFLPS